MANPSRRAGWAPVMMLQADTRRRSRNASALIKVEDAEGHIGLAIQQHDATPDRDVLAVFGRAFRANRRFD
jgi:hypothetical protein